MTHPIRLLPFLYRQVYSLYGRNWIPAVIIIAGTVALMTLFGVTLVGPGPPQQEDSVEN